MSEKAPLSNGRLEAVHEWIVNHDESWLFVVLYIGLAVVLSIWISLFWLVAVVFVHFIFELIRQRRHFASRRRIWGEALWELKLDIALVLFALVVSLYMDLALGVVGLQSAARAGSAAQAGLRGGARFAAWQRLIRGVMLSVDDVAQVARVVARGKTNDPPTDDSGDEPESVGVAMPSWRQNWGKGDWIAVGMALVCLALLLITPLITEHTPVSTLIALVAELHPYPAWNAAVE
jgi:hypothetical protein